MRIDRIKIEKFRSIYSAEVRLGDITALVGENNAGKTAVLRAINAVLNYELEAESFHNRRHQYAARNNTYITIAFSDVPATLPYVEYANDGKMELKLSYSYSQDRQKYQVQKEREWVTAPDDLLASLANHIRYVYIPVGRANQGARYADSAVFGELIEKHFARQMKNRDSISSNVRKVSRRIHDNVLSKLERQMNSLYLQDKSVGFKIDFPADLDYRIFLNSIEVGFSEDGTSYPMQEWGSGTRSLAAIAIHRANALLNDASIILGIEEPETNLHPQAQRRFLHSLRNGMDDKEMQVLMTTHSPVLLDELEHHDVILVRRVPDKVRGFKSKLSQLAQDFWDRNDLDDFKHYQFFRYRNSDFFFSKFVVVGESKNDCQVFETLLEDELGDTLYDVSFLNAEGIKNIQYPYFLLKELEIPCAFIVDRDFFFPYLNDSLDSSRDERTGLPMYKEQLKRNPVIKNLLPTESAKRELIRLRREGYRKSFEYLQSMGFLTMNYMLEIDLFRTSAARNKAYAKYKIPVEKQSEKTLLIDYKKSIKKIEELLDVLSSIPKAAYPESYLKIKNSLIESINKTICIH